MRIGGEEDVYLMEREDPWRRGRTTEEREDLIRLDHGLIVEDLLCTADRG